MTAKQFLQQAYRLNEKIESHTRELEQLRRLSLSLPKMDMSKDIVSCSKKQDASYVEIIEKIVELENQITAEIDDYVDFKTQIHNAINSVEKPNENLVLRYRYIEMMSWDEIAEKMNYSNKQIRRIHYEALKSLKDVHKCP